MWYLASDLEVEAIPAIMSEFMIPPRKKDGSEAFWQSGRIRLGESDDQLEKSHSWTGKTDGASLPAGSATQDALILWANEKLEALLEEADDDRPRKIVVQVDRWESPTIAERANKAIKRRLVNTAWLERNAASANVGAPSVQPGMQVQPTVDLASLYQAPSQLEGLSISVPVAEIMEMQQRFTLAMIRPAFEVEAARLQLVKATLDTCLSALDRMGKAVAQIGADRRLELEHAERMRELEIQGESAVEAAKWGQITGIAAPIVGSLGASERVQEVIAGAIEGLSPATKDALFAAVAEGRIKV